MLVPSTPPPWDLTCDSTPSRMSRRIALQRTVGQLSAALERREDVVSVALVGSVPPAARMNGATLMPLSWWRTRRLRSTGTT
jgi:hypothetical protein